MSGSDAFALQSRARQDGDHYVLQGRKLWITNANEADLFIVFATINPEAGYRGITAFLVERGTPGFTVGKKEDKLGIRASSTCELIFEECRVPGVERDRRGRQGVQGRDRDVERGPHRHRRADARPGGRRARPRGAYTKERKQFGRTIADFQGVQFQLARAATDVEAARLLVYNAARLRDHGKPFLTEAAMCKIFSSEVAERVASLAVNLFGGNGFVKEYPVEKLYRDAKIGQIYEGTSNLQLQTIAKQITRITSNVEVSSGRLLPRVHRADPLPAIACCSDVASDKLRHAHRRPQILRVVRPRNRRRHQLRRCSHQTGLGAARACSPSRISTNSSPPQRNRRSSAPMQLRRASASACRAASPAACP